MNNIQKTEIGKDVSVIILASGVLKDKLPFVKMSCTCPALIPVHTKYLAIYSIEYYLSQGLTKILLAVHDSQLSLVKKELGRLNDKVTLVAVPDTEGVNKTLGYILLNFKLASDIIVNTVTTVPTVLPAMNEVCISEVSAKQGDWSAVTFEGNLIDFLPKRTTNKLFSNAFTGIFRASKDDVLLAINNSQSTNDLLDVVQEYSNRQEIKFKKILWLDFGHEIQYYDSRAQLMQSRSFNSIKINTERGIVSKYSSRQEKLLEEFNYIGSLPDELACYFPRLFGSLKSTQGNSQYSMEYYAYPSLAEYALYWEIGDSHWSRIFGQLSSALKCFSEYKFSISKEANLNFYFDRLIERVKLFSNQLESKGSTFKTDNLRINGKLFPSLSSILPQIRLKVEGMYREEDFGVMHGDLCFNNILYDLPTGLIRLIDPRGSFGEKCRGIYGDLKYDLAKLHHSAVAGYDYIVNDLYFYSREGSDVSLEINWRKNNLYIKELTKKLIEKVGLTQNSIKFISGLIFLSICALHEDSPDRQEAFYCLGLELTCTALESN